MSMEEWPDNHLDDLFRKSAEEYDVPYNPTDWPDLARRLDEHNRLTWFDRISRWGGIGALLLLLLGGLGWMVYAPSAAGVRQQTVVSKASRPAAPSAGYNRVGRFDESNRPSQQQPTNVPAEAGQDQHIAVLTPPPATNEAEAILPTMPARQQTTTQPDVPSPKLMPSPERQRTPNVPTSPGGEPSTVPTRRVVDEPTERLMARRQQSSAPVSVRLAGKRWRAAPRPRYVAIRANTDIRPVLDVPVQAEAIQQATSGINDEAELSTDTPNAPALPDAHWLPAIAALQNLNSVVQAKLNVPEVVEPDIEKPVRRIQPKLSRFSAFVFVSPDLTTVGLQNFYEPGSNMGVSVQYQLTDRLSLHTGVMLSRKRYETYTSEYVFPWKWEVMPTGIYGDCRMIDVPLNLRYDWLLRPRGDGRAPARWFASAGATSYFIQRETYIYEFENPGDPRIKPTWRGWDNIDRGKPGGSFGFSNINLSVGYERPISRRLSWQVEPFMKVPLRQVGQFKVRLVSTGAFAGLRYRF